VLNYKEEEEEEEEEEGSCMATGLLKIKNH
jgi:hypothetical protein